MSLHKKMEFEEKDIAYAISKACKTLNVSQENLDIEVLTTGTTGIFGLCRQKTRLRVAIKEDYYREKEEKQPEDEEKPKAPKTRTPKKQKASAPEKKKENLPAPPAKSDQVESGPETGIQLDANISTQVETDLNRILELMGFPSTVSISINQENVDALIKGEYDNEVVGENGKVLDSLQYLLRKMIGKKFSDKAIISLDAGDFRANRDEELKQLGLKLAAEVKKGGKTKSIPSLNPYERRIVHITLQDDKDIRSRSVGEGLFKKVLIYRPGKGRKGSARRRRGGKNKK
ncbi:MAG: Jag N-terminal domain-containing protein [Deltaproteobacteria bacterium]|jgi:spoIIIJ-associated protein|nr:Jag N-terminal domain-containing protein [Deltaproteobacteria bacterium]